jgi:methylated-DNA-[protein]-cysteine S-methyltransferase
MADGLQLFLERIDTPIGELLLVADREKNLRAIDWAEYEPRMHRFLRLHYGEDGYRLEPAASPSHLSAAMKNYFAGELGAIDSLPVKTAGTPFQRAVWGALREIPLGATESYGKLAERIGRPTAVRAVGLANGSNPHRCTVSSRHRSQRFPHRLRRRYGTKALASGARKSTNRNASFLALANLALAKMSGWPRSRF